MPNPLDVRVAHAVRVQRDRGVYGLAPNMTIAGNARISVRPGTQSRVARALRRYARAGR